MVGMTLVAALTGSKNMLHAAAAFNPASRACGNGSRQALRKAGRSTRTRVLSFSFADQIHTVNMNIFSTTDGWAAIGG